MLNEMCGSLNNWFVRGQDGDIRSGKYTIKDGMVEAPFLLEGQYFRIVGSIFNDGIYQYPAYDLIDEVFEGEIWCMRVPQEVVELAKDIDDWNKQYAAKVQSPFTSESFGGYSYTKASGSNGGGANTLSWQDVFSARMKRWRKI